MEECLRAEVERVVYTSSAAVVGPAAHGKTADETQLFTAGELGIPYVSSVHEAEVEAMRVAARGLPLVCVNPAICFGAGDHLLTSTRLVRSFLLGRIPVYTDGAISIVDVRDAAEGHLLADRRGQVGERYILGGRNFTFDRLFADLGRLSGIDPPVRLPRRRAPGRARLLASAGRTPPSTPLEVRAASQWWTYRSTRARRELGWSARPHEETLEATVGWHLEREHDRIARTRRSQQFQFRVAGAAIGAPRRPSGCCGARSRPVPEHCPGDHALPLQGADRPGLPLRQGSPPAAQRRHRVRGGQGAVPQARPARDRGVDGAALGTRPRARRPGDPRLAPHPGVPRLGRRSQGGRVSRMQRASRRRARRAWPLVLMAWERWQKLEPEQKERYMRQAREYAQRGRKVVEQRRRKPR